MSENIDCAGTVIDEVWQADIVTLCSYCHTHRQLVLDLIEHGILNPQGVSDEDWLFCADDLYRLRKAVRLQHDLEVNLAGIALVLDLLDEIDYLKSQVK